MFFALLLFISVTRGVGQDVIYSQYYNAPHHINPAFTGLFNYPNFNINYRNQWPGIQRAYETYSATVDHNFAKQNIGVGGILLNDSQGDGTISTTKISGLVAYNLRFNNDWYLKFGVEAGWVQNRLDWTKLVFFDQIDPEFGAFDRNGVPNPSSEVQPASLNNGYLDINLGFLLVSPHFYFGVSVDHINGPYNGFINPINDGRQEALPILFSVHGGYQIVLLSDNKGKPSTFISPNVLLVTQGGFTQVNAGAYLQVNVLFGGLWLRHTVNNADSVIFSFGTDLEKIKIGYSYDLTTSALGIETGGSHEISISIGLKHLEKKESKYNDCLSLFR